MGTNRREIKNIVVNQPAQFRLAIPFLILLILNFFFMLLTFWSINRPVVLSDSISQEQLMVSGAIHSISTQIVTYDFCAILLTGLLTIIFWLIYSHRIFGPEVPILKGLEALIDGRYGERIVLRKRDELTEIAASINRLSEKLAQGKK